MLFCIMIEFISKFFYFGLNKLRNFDFYYVCMIFVLRFKSRNFKGAELVKSGSDLPLKLDFNIKVCNDLKHELADLFDSKELKLRQQRLNYLIKFNERYIVLDRSFRELFFAQRKSFLSFDTYTLSEIGLNHIFVSHVTQERCSVDILNELLRRIYSRLEFHPFGMTNNHFFRNIISALCITVEIKDSIKFNLFSRYIQYYIDNYFSEDGLLIYEKSSSYQALFLKWQAQLVFIFNFHGIETDYSRFFISNFSRHARNYITVLRSKIFIGDITPDVSTVDLLNSLKFYRKFFNIKTAAKSLIDKKSGHGVYYLNKNTMIYFVLNTQVFASSHAHFPSFNFVISHKGKNIIDDVGRINYTKEFFFQTKAKNHNSVFFYNGSELTYLDFDYFDSSLGEIIFRIRDTKSEDVSGFLRITLIEDSICLSYNLRLKRSRKLYFILVHPSEVNFTFEDVSIISCEKILSASDYGVTDGYLNRSCFETRDRLFVHNVQFNISF